MDARVLVAGVGVAAVLAGVAGGQPAGAGQASGEPSPAGTAAAARQAGPTVTVVAPLDGPVLRRFVPPTAPYGPGHRGVKLGASPGDPVGAATAGRVSFAGEVAGTGWVTVSHGGGLATTYGPVEAVVERGQRVRPGETLGHVAAAHQLHWGARVGDDYVDPLSLLGPWEVHLVASGP